MGFWLFMLGMTLLTPAIMIGFGGHFSKNAPREINHTFGYRTARSMRSMETWEFAHSYFGARWLRTGWSILVPSVAIMAFAFGRDADSIGTWGALLCCVQLVALIWPIFPTERALERLFDQDGRPRNP